VFSKHYQDELAFLRELGREFSRAHPEAAPFLSGPGGDPDVERLLEGFAFLTARIREKLDDEVPEVTHALLEIFFPHYLRPIPAMTVIAFEPGRGNETVEVPRGTLLDSVPVNGVSCRFRTAFDVSIPPLRLTQCKVVVGSPSRIVLGFEAHPGVSLSRLSLKRLRLHFGGEGTVARALYLCLSRYVTKITARPSEKWSQGKPVCLPAAACRPAGLSDDEALLPHPNSVFPGFRLLEEYLAFPTKFLFVDLTGLEGFSAMGEAGGFDLVFDLSRLPHDMPPVSPSDVLLYCTPAVNLFPHDAEPIRVDHRKTEYAVRPAGANREAFEVYSVDLARGMSRATGERREYRALHAATRLEGEDARFFRTRVRPSVIGEGADVFFSIVDSQARESVPDVETLSLELTSSNRQLPKELGIGDIRPLRGSGAKHGGYRNLTRPTASVPPPLGTDLPWRLLSHLALNYQSLARPETLRELLWLYPFRARGDRQAERAFRLLCEGIKSVNSRSVARMFRGAPLRGLDVSLDLAEENFGGEGDLALFGTVFDEFLSQYVSLNSFSQLTIKGTSFGEVHAWPPRVGKRILL
jgi:type VI secretion system protein ImpG